MAKKIPVLGNDGYLREFGSFTFTNNSDGSIKITSPSWIRDNITTVTLREARGQGRDKTVECHVRAKEPLRLAFEELSAKGLAPLIHTFDGLWVPRHMTWKLSRPLSSHSWGIAFDLNQAANPYGGPVTSANRTLNEVFNRYGFAWGGDFGGRDVDGMHWELAVPDAYKALTAKPVPKAALILAVYRGNSQYSFHRLQSAVRGPNGFTASRLEVGELVNKQTTDVKAPIRQILQDLSLIIDHEGDHLADAADPRYYLFVLP